MVQFICAYTTPSSLALLLLPVGDLDFDYLRDFELWEQVSTEWLHTNVLLRAFGCLTPALAFIHDHSGIYEDPFLR